MFCVERDSLLHGTSPPRRERNGERRPFLGSVATNTVHYQFIYFGVLGAPDQPLELLTRVDFGSRQQGSALFVLHTDDISLDKRDSVLLRSSFLLQIYVLRIDYSEMMIETRCVLFQLPYSKIILAFITLL